MKVSPRLTLGFGLLALIGIGIAIIGALKMRARATDLDEMANNRMVKVAQFTEMMDTRANSGHLRGDDANVEGLLFRIATDRNRRTEAAT